MAATYKVTLGKFKIQKSESYTTVISKLCKRLIMAVDVSVINAN